MNCGDKGAMETSHQQESIPERLHVVKDVEGVPPSRFLQELKYPEAENEHLRKESKPGSKKFEKIQGTKDSPGGGWGNNIIPHPPEVQIFNENGFCPRHRPGFWAAHQNCQGVPHPGQLTGQKIEIYTLSAAIGVPPVAEQADLHPSPPKMSAAIAFTPLESPTACSGDEDKIPFGPSTAFKARVSPPIGRSKTF
jgi:hypothetical protein